jgi:transposase
MNSVGIDISKGKSMIAVMRPFGEIVVTPYEVRHTDSELGELAKLLRSLDGETRIVMESTGNYHTPIARALYDAGFYVSVVNAILIHDYKNNSLRKVKTDKKDAIKIANYGLDQWLELPKYAPEEDTRLMLKNCYRQYQQYSKVQTILKNNLISLLDTAFPNANRLFSSPPRADGSEKWVDFIATFWHCECVSSLSEKAFVTKYQKWCIKHGYNFSQDKAVDIYTEACEHFSVMPKTDTAKLLVEQAVSQLQATSYALATLKKEMQELASSLPEYPVVMKMFGVGPTLGPQLMAEVGDIRRFHSKKALVAFAGLDSPPNDSGQVTNNHKRMTKRGSPALRRTLFLVMGVILQNSPVDEPVYQFMDKKRAEGKPYRVYMMASANKFLRIYYASVKAHLDALEKT